MNTFPFPRTVSRCLAVVSLAGAAVAVHGQAANAPGQARQNAATLEVTRATQATARGHAKAGNVTAADDTLLTLNLAGANSAEGHLELAQRLVQLADDLVADAETRHVAALVRKALAHLDDVQRLAPNGALAVSAKLLSGRIQERYLGDVRAALVHYRAAAQLAPQSAVAREASERLQKADDTFRSSAKGGR